MNSEFVELRRKLIKREFKRMNDMQFSAVTTVDGPVLILAGAGSGKTTVLINRISNMIRFGHAYELDSDEYATEEDVSELRRCLDENLPAPEWLGVGRVRPWEILAITFTNKAARELKERLDASVGEDAGDVWAATFHSTCARILRRNADRLGFSQSFTIYSADDQKRLVKDVMKRLNIDDKFLSVKSVLGEISHAKNELITPEQYAEGAQADVRRKMISDCYCAYQKQLKEYDAMDFDDLIFNTVKLFETQPDVLDYYQNRFKYIMIDEYQDTNFAQYRFAKLLAEKHRNICVVGDDDQSIYRFRGATIENILHFEDEYRDAKVIRLEQNYRSTQVILDAANAVIANNTGRKGKNLWTDRTDGGRIICYTASDEGDEARYIADRIQDNLQKGMKLSDHAILYRMNAQSNAIENVFMRAGLSYRVVGGLKFFDRKEIRDVIAYLNLINNPSDGVALARIINEPKRGIGDTTVANLSAIAAELGISMLEAAKNANQYAALSRASAKLKAFADMMSEFSDLADEVPISELFKAVLEKTHYVDSLCLLGEEGKDRIDNVNEFTSSIIQYESETENATLAGFLEEIALITDMDRDDNDSDRIWMMTMHTAKGLEFPCVFLVGVEEGIFPGNQAVYGTPEDMEEERRLAYVGITRAKTQLYITNASSRMLFGRTERPRPSRFIAEIPEHLTEKTQAQFRSGGFAGFGGFGGSSDSNGCSGRTASSYGRSRAAQGERKPQNNVGSKYASRAAASAAAAEQVAYSIGERVRHKAFGEGTIISAVKMGNDTMLEIAFDRVGTKRIMTNFARLEKL